VLIIFIIKEIADIVKRTDSRETRDNGDRSLITYRFHVSAMKNVIFI